MNEQRTDFPIPDNEQQRLETLQRYDILDTPLEPAFDNLTELARKIFDTPYAIICFLDEKRQWFKSHSGLDFREKDRECAFCNHVIVNKDVTVITDTHTDSRISGNNFFVSEPPEIRAYAGAPLETQNGFVLGTCSVLDSEPREFTAVELDILKGLAAAAMNQVELRYKNSERRRVNEMLRDELKALELKVDTHEQEMDELLHRTKNSFQQIRGILRNQKNKLEESDGYRALDLAESKLHTFIVLYEQLQESRNQETISIKPYLEKLIDNIREIYSSEVEAVHIRRDLEEHELGSGSAVKFGIALNEFVTNAYQHVFLPGEGSELIVRFREVGPDYELTVTDDGPGPSDSEDFHSHRNSGLELIRNMIEHGNQGTARFNEQGESAFQVLLPKDPPN